MEQSQIGCHVSNYLTDICSQGKHDYKEPAFETCMFIMMHILHEHGDKTAVELLNNLTEMVATCPYEHGLVVET